MNIPDALIPHPWPFFAHFLLLFILYRAIRTAPWYKIAQLDSLQVFLGAVVVLGFIWTMKAGIKPGLNFHFLGAMVFYLMFGWEFALFGMLLVLLCVTAIGASGIESYSINALLMVVIPLYCCHQIFKFCDQKLPNNYFVYIWCNGFFGTALMTIITLSSICAFLIVTNVYSWDFLAYEYIPFFPLLILPESLLEGGLTAIFVTFKPQWVSTFDDSRYIRGK